MNTLGLDGNWLVIMTGFDGNWLVIMAGFDGNWLVVDMPGFAETRLG